MQQNPLSCDHCGETFQRREHRDRHVLRHTGLKPFQCNVCSKSFSRKDSGAQRDDSLPIIVGNLSQGQDRPASSPLTAEGADFQEEAFIAGELHLNSEEWETPPAVPSDTSGMSTMASSTTYTTVPDTSPSWPNVLTVPDTFTLNEDITSFGAMTDNTWVSWNSSMAHFSFPWFMNGLEMPLELPDMAPRYEDVAHHAALNQQVVQGPAYLIRENICSTYTKPCHPFPEPEPMGLQMAGAEVFGHIHNLPGQAVEGLNDFYKTQRRDTTAAVIPQDILHAFVELYFEYFDSQFPFLHPSRMEESSLPWILLLAVAAVGSHYSEIQGAKEYNTTLCDLLARAVELPASSHRDKIVLQHKRSSLATMCWDLVGKADKRRQSTQTEAHSEEIWQAWIAEESELRLATCFTDDLLGNDPKPDAFAAKVILLELYIDNMNYYRQMRSSQLLQSSFASYLKSPATNDTQYVPNPSLQRPDTVRSESALLNTTIDQLTLRDESDHGACTDTILHVIAILSMIPLETLHSATGWETNKEQMMKSKMHLKDFFKNDSVKARKGLWHATCIFKATRSSRRLACYDALCLTVAMGYIYCYSETRASLAPTPTRPVITRLDQLQDRDAIEEWIENGGDNVVHLTGVGLLDGSDHCVRFLRDLEKTLVSQIAWRGFCRAFASSFAQLRRGETPTKSSREYLNAE
ncbi:hypothetical protein FPRO04_12862 [Fusarium proliferatum]|nr:hypothetical protein FPRO03_10555 [Fusarium proliferatum]KAG4267480.1 hypothetical protein FPRO04_12862 [Fusarium proliferatum]